MTVVHLHKLKSQHQPVDSQEQSWFTPTKHQLAKIITTKKKKNNILTQSKSITQGVATKTVESNSNFKNF